MKRAGLGGVFGLVFWGVFLGFFCLFWKCKDIQPKADKKTSWNKYSTMHHRTEFCSADIQEKHFKKSTNLQKLQTFLWSLVLIPKTCTAKKSCLTHYQDKTANLHRICSGTDDKVWDIDGIEKDCMVSCYCKCITVLLPQQQLLPPLQLLSLEQLKPPLLLPLLQMQIQPLLLLQV